MIASDVPESFFSTFWYNHPLAKKVYWGGLSLCFYLTVLLRISSFNVWGEEIKIEVIEIYISTVIQVFDYQIIL